MFNKKSLKSNLRNFFASRIFSRGVEYYNGNCVESLKVFPAKDEKKIKRISDFFVEDLAGSTTLNIEGLKLLSLAEFRKLYVAEMQTYFERWENNSTYCFSCLEDINGAEELFRYSRHNLHLKCFEKEYKKERILKRISTKIDLYGKDYFDLVLKSTKQLELML